MSGAGNQHSFTSSTLLEQRHQRQASKKEARNLEQANSQNTTFTSRFSPPSNCSTSKTVRRILAACMISLFTLMGNISLDLSKTLELWRSTEKALASLPSCRSLLALHLVARLQDQGSHSCCPENGESDAFENQSLLEHTLEDLAVFCKDSREKIHGTDPQCQEVRDAECKIIVNKIRERLNSTQGAEALSGQSRVISEILDTFGRPEEDLQALKSNPDWADVASLRLILGIKVAILKSHHDMPPSSEGFRALWYWVSVILTYSVFASESVQECWTENRELSILFTQHKGIPLFTPSLDFLSLQAIKRLEKELDSLQACLLEKSHKKLSQQSKDILSLLSLKISLSAIASLIYPIVLVSFKEMMDWMQNYARSLKERTEELKRERRLAEDLLHQMLPKSVARQLRKGGHVEAENYDQVTIFFSDVVGFTSIAASCTPLQVVEMLNNLYVCFDTRIESYGVYKVETIGDAYMVVSGLPERNGTKHADEIAKMSLDLVAAVRQVVIPHMPTGKLQLRAGIHTAQKIHISSATYLALLADDAYDIELRGEIEVKGKGKMKTYWLLGNKNYSIQNDSLVCRWNPAMSRKKKVESSLASIQKSSTGAVSMLASEKSTIASHEQLGSISHAGMNPCSLGTAAHAADHGLGSCSGFQEILEPSHLLMSGPLAAPREEERGPDLLDHHCYRPDCERPSLEKTGSLPGLVDQV